MTNELAILRRMAEVSGRPFTVSEVADLLGLPGAWTLRRLEKRGVVPSVRRSLAHGDRFYPPEDVAAMRRALTRTKDSK